MGNAIDWECYKDNDEKNERLTERNMVTLKYRRRVKKIKDKE